jgi:hypothetical protein
MPNTSAILFKHEYFFIFKNKLHLYKTKKKTLIRGQLKI